MTPCEWGADTEEPCAAPAQWWVWQPGDPRHAVCSSHAEELKDKLELSTLVKVRITAIDPHHRRSSIIDLGKR